MIKRSGSAGAFGFGRSKAPRSRNGSTGRRLRAGAAGGGSVARSPGSAAAAGKLQHGWKIQVRIRRKGMRCVELIVAERTRGGRSSVTRRSRTRRGRDGERARAEAAEVRSAIGRVLRGVRAPRQRREAASGALCVGERLGGSALCWRRPRGGTLSQALTCSNGGRQGRRERWAFAVRVFARAASRRACARTRVQLRGGV